MKMSSSEKSIEVITEENTFLPSSLLNNPLWSITLLAMAWALTLTTSTLLTTIGPLSAKELGASDTMSVLTLGIFLMGAAVSSVPSAFLFQKFGRYIGFSVGCMCQLIGSVLGALALQNQILSLIYVACFFVGLGQGLGQFYRFSAVEVSPPELKSRAVTYVLSGGVIAAFMGPICANNTATMIGRRFVGAYITSAIVGFINQFVISGINFSLSAKTHPIAMATVVAAPKRNLKEIIYKPKFILSCTVATIAHTMMVILMSNVTLSMSSDGYSLAEMSTVMELHFFAMFGPGFVTGRLINAYGSFVVAFIGGIVFIASGVCFVTGIEAWNYFLGMIFLGLGWNFSFSAGTVMLTDCYMPSEATNVQAVNDFILFTTAGVGSLLSGLVYSTYGWNVLVYSIGVLMIINILLFIVARRMKNSDEQQSLLAPSIDETEGLRAPSFSGIDEMPDAHKIGYIRSISNA